MQKKMSAWQSGLLATSALAATFVASSHLWQQGQPQWGVLLAFAAVWVLISISWSSIDYSDRSGVILARIVDHNVSQLHDRMDQLEQELHRMRKDREKTEQGLTPKRLKKAS